MQSEGLKSIVKKKYKVSTSDSKHSYMISENHLKRNFRTQEPGMVWVSDITYIHTKQGWLYLTIVMDLFDRTIIGCAISDNMTAKETVVAAWKMALINRPLTKH